MAVGYLGVLAAWPGLRNGLPPALAWFGRTNSAVTIAVVSALLVLFAVALARSGGSTRTAELVKGGSPVRDLDSGACPPRSPLKSPGCLH